MPRGAARVVGALALACIVGCGAASTGQVSPPAAHAAAPSRDGATRTAPRAPRAPRAALPPRASDAPSVDAPEAASRPTTTGATPASTPPFSQLDARTWQREGEACGLTYVEVLRDAEAPSTPAPLVVILHGRGDRPSRPAGPYASLGVPVRLVLPRGPQLVGDGFGWLPAVVAEGRTALLSDGLRDVSARLARLLEHLVGTHPTIGRPVLVGFSQGGMLTLTTAVLHPEAVGLALPLAGWLPPPLWPSSPPPADAPPLRAMHALDDERIPFAPSLEAYARLRALGWDVDLTRVERAGHRMTPAMDATLHAWLVRALRSIMGVGEPAVAPAIDPLTPTPPREGARRAPRRPARPRAPR